MWGDDRAYLLDDLLIEADLMAELQETCFWEGYREPEDHDGPELELREDEYDWAA